MPVLSQCHHLVSYSSFRQSLNISAPLAICMLTGYQNDTRNQLLNHDKSSPRQGKIAFWELIYKFISPNEVKE